MSPTNSSGEWPSLWGTKGRLIWAEDGTHLKASLVLQLLRGLPLYIIVAEITLTNVLFSISHLSSSRSKLIILLFLTFLNGRSPKSGVKMVVGFFWGLFPWLTIFFSLWFYASSVLIIILLFLSFYGLRFLFYKDYSLLDCDLLHRLYFNVMPFKEFFKI